MCMVTCRSGAASCAGSRDRAKTRVPVRHPRLITLSEALCSLRAGGRKQIFEQHEFGRTGTILDPLPTAFARPTKLPAPIATTFRPPELAVAPGRILARPAALPDRTESTERAAFARYQTACRNGADLRSGVQDAFARTTDLAELSLLARPQRTSVPNVPLHDREYSLAPKSSLISFLL